MTPQALVIILVLLPLVGSAIAGMFGRRIGDVPSMAITTAFLFISCALGWTVFAGEVFGGWPHFVAFSVFLHQVTGQIFAMFVLTVAAAEAAVGLAILVTFFRNRGGIAIDDASVMKG